MKTLLKIVLTSVLVATLVGCASTSTTGSGGEARKAKTKLIIDGSNAPADSLFSKVELKMGVKQVGDLIGFGNDSKRYSTGKDWIPYYFGSDGSRTEYYYKGEGRLIFGGNQRLIKIIVDASEDGYK